MKNRKAPIQTSNPLVDELFFHSIEISDELLEQLLALPRNELIQDLERILNFAIDNYDEVQLWDNENGEKTSFAFHAVFLLTELKAVESFPLLLKLCHCKDELMDFYFGDYTTECMWQDAMLLGNNQVAASVQFFKDGGGGFCGNCIVSNGLNQLYLHYPQKQDEIILAYKDLLNFLYAKSPDEDDLELNELIINDIGDTQNTSMISLCKPFWEEERMWKKITSDWEKFEQIQLSKRSHKREILTLRERLNYFVTMNDKFERIDNDSERFRPDYFDDYLTEYSQPLMPINTEPKIQRNEPCPCGSGLKYKKCCLNKEGFTG